MIRLEKVTCAELRKELLRELQTMTTSARGAAAGEIVRALLDADLSPAWWASRDDLANRIEACRAASSKKVWFAVGNVAEHDGYATSRSVEDMWTSEHPSGWTYQSVTGAHGTILYEGSSRNEALKVLDKWLECEAPATGKYCYSHNPTAGQS